MNGDRPPIYSMQLLGQLARHAAQRPDAPAYRIPDAGSLSFRQLALAVGGFTNLLRSAIPPGAVVMLSCPNCLEYPIAFLAILAAGCTVFPISPDAADAELIKSARESNAKCVVGDERSVRLLQPVLNRALPVEQALAVAQAELNHGAWSRGDLLLQSSGTTGLPKIVRRSALSLDAEALAVAESVGFGPNERILMAVPLTHSYGLEHGLLAPVWAGSCVHLCRGLDPSILLPQLMWGGITLFPGVPSMFEMIAGVADAGVCAPTLRRAYSAGAPLPRSVYDRFLARFGTPVTQLYGASELGSVTFNPLDDASAVFDPASAGKGMRDVSIRILSLDGRDDALPFGQQGQVAIRAASMFDGYLNAPAPLIDGHFSTGDLGHLDAHGRLFITGRIKLLIDVGGLKVNPLEVEAVLETHPAIAACIVVPVRQSETVFRLKAVITPRNGSARPPVAELRELARAHLSAYKVPRLFEFRDTLPRSRTGKILRHLVETA